MYSCALQALTGTLRPYKTWLITPVTFCVIAVFLLIMPVVAAPLEAVAAASAFPVFRNVSPGL